MRTEADSVICLGLRTEHWPVEAVRSWATSAGLDFREARISLVTFNPDIALALGYRLDLSTGLHALSPSLWLIVRLWAQPGDADHASAAFVGPLVAHLNDVSGSFWSDELLKPADLASATTPDIAILDGELGNSRAASRQLSSRAPWDLHPNIARAFVERTMPRSVWTTSQKASPAAQVLLPGEHTVVSLRRRGARI